MAAKSSSVSFRIHADIPFVMLVPINGSMLLANTSHVVRAATARRGIFFKSNEFSAARQKSLWDFWSAKPTATAQIKDLRRGTSW